jgi:apolipoprotein N-acyltransferase
MNIFKILLTGLAVGWLISRGAAVDQNWVLVFLGLIIWCRFLKTRDQAVAVQYTFVIWFFTALFALDWLNVLGFDAWFALALLLSSIWALAIYFWKRFVQQGKFLVDGFSIAAVVVLVELFLAYFPFGGFNWIRISYLWSSSPFIESSYSIGLASISFVAIFCAALLSDSDRKLRSTISVAVVFVFLIGLSNIHPNMSNFEEIQVLAIQGSVPRVGLDFNAQRAAVFENHLKATRYAVGKLEPINKPELILWPENSSDIDPYLNPDVTNSLDALSRELEVPLLFGAVLENGNNLSNAAVLSDSNGLNTVYVKQKLVPFGEYLPFRNLLAPVISRFDRLSRDFISGGEAQPTNIKGKQLGILICYEVAFDQIWRGYAQESVYTVVLTNNATYGETKQPLQQLRITRVQAISNGKPVLVISTSGISAHISETGVIKDLITENVPASIYAELPKSLATAPSHKVQDVLHWVSFLFLLSATVFNMRNRLFKK